MQILSCTEYILSHRLPIKVTTFISRHLEHTVGYHFAYEIQVSSSVYFAQKKILKSER